jgi:hypothetical protein
MTSLTLTRRAAAWAVVLLTLLAYLRGCVDGSQGAWGMLDQTTVLAWEDGFRDGHRSGRTERAHQVVEALRPTGVLGEVAWTKALES